MALTEQTLQAILERYTDSRALPVACGSGEIDDLRPRLERAAINQAEAGQATFSRYALWADTVRDTLCEGLRLVEANQAEAARAYLVAAANSLSAFSDIQAVFDEPDDITD